MPPTSLKVGLSSSSTSLMAIEPRGRHRRIADVAFVDGPGDRTRDHRRVVGTGDRHRNLLGRAVGRRVGDRVVDDVAGIEVLDGGLVQRVRPGADRSSVKLPRLLSPTVAATSLNVGLSSSSMSLMAIEPLAVTGASPTLPSLTAPVTVPVMTDDIVGAGDRHRDLLGRAVGRRVGDGVVDDVARRPGPGQPSDRACRSRCRRSA